MGECAMTKLGCIVDPAPVQRTAGLLLDMYREVGFDEST
jgi:hypothetical protein